MVRAFLAWIAASAIGVALIMLLPDDLFGAGALFRLSDRHGPSLADGVGLVFVLCGWFFYLAALWSRRARMPRAPALMLIAGALVAVVGCVTAFAADQDGLAIGLGAAALAAQLGLGMLSTLTRRA